MRPHPFDPVSAALGVIVAGIGALVAFGGNDSFDSGWLLALGALVLGLGLVPWTRGRRRDHDDVISESTGARRLTPAAYGATVLDDTLEALRAAALGSDDAAGYFPAMYARVTRRVIDDAGAGLFGDGARMARFVEGFADRYLDARAEPSSAARCWRGSFDVARDPSLLIVQHLLLGINAHVNFDLPQTVVGLVDGGAELGAVRPDFDAVNAILAATYDDVMGDLGRVTRWTSKAAAGGGGRIFNFSLRAARDQAWRAAVRLSAEAETARRDDLDRLDALVAALAFMVTSPTRPVRWLVPLLRRLETRDPEKVTRALLGPLV